MGCDIYAYIETSSLQGNVWWLDAKFWCGRDYSLFGLMSGVRGGPPLFPPRGLPDDIGIGVRAELETFSPEIHSHSYLSIEEVEKVNNEYFKQHGEPPGWFLAMYGAMKGFAINGIEPRLVFWFDS